MVGLDRFELSTSRLSGVRSNQLSYRPLAAQKQNVSLQLNSELSLLYKGGDPAAGSPTATLLRLHPNYQPTVDDYLPKVSLSLSGRTSFRGVTGGVYKARERIHPGMLIRDY